MFRGKAVGHSTSSSILNDFFGIYSAFFHEIFESDVLTSAWFTLAVSRNTLRYEVSQKHLISYPIPSNAVSLIYRFLSKSLLSHYSSAGAVWMSPDFVVACTKHFRIIFSVVLVLKCVLCISRHDRFHLDLFSSTHPTRQPRALRLIIVITVHSPRISCTERARAPK